MLLREIFIGGARAPPAPPHATALNDMMTIRFSLYIYQRTFIIGIIFAKYRY